MDRKKNPLFRLADIEHFVLRERGHPVGRVAAALMPAYNERFAGDGRPATGFVGFLDVAEGDTSGAAELLSAAEEWLTVRGARRALGPYQYFSGQEMGLLVDGFDGPPALFQTHARSGDRLLYEKAGYREAFGLATYRFDAEVVDRLGPDLIAAGEAAASRLGLSVRVMTRGRRDLELVRRLFNESFASSAEIVPYDRELFHHIVGPMRPLIDPRLVRFIERDGQAVGFTLMAPDLNQLLLRMGGRVRPLDLLRMPARARRVRTAVVLLAGVLPRMPMGAAPVLLGEIFRGAREGGYREIRTTWVHDANVAMSHVIKRSVGIRPDRRYAMFERMLGES